MIYGLLFQNVVKILHKQAFLDPAPAHLWQGPPISPAGVRRPSSFPSSEVRDSLPFLAPVPPLLSVWNFPNPLPSLLRGAKENLPQTLVKNSEDFIPDYYHWSHNYCSRGERLTSTLLKQKARASPTLGRQASRKVLEDLSGGGGCPRDWATCVC